MMMYKRPEYADLLGQFAATIVELWKTGHATATSGNYSIKAQDGTIFVSQSGVDKAHFSAHHFIAVDKNGTPLEGELAPGRKPSDEAQLHRMVYQNFSEANCVIHTHHLATLHFADSVKKGEWGELSGLELIKAFKGIKTHEACLSVPIFENTQDILQLSKELEQTLKGKSDLWGFIMRGHGLTMWGDNLATTKRHLDAFIYLFSYLNEKRS
jgi:methylthioribulose-1-phosphate dehydratase